MRIYDLRIRGFRGIRQGDLYFGQHTAIIGPNGSGKSAIIEAVALLLGRDRMVRTLTQHDFFASDPTPRDRIWVSATLTGFPSNDPGENLDWFRMDRGVPCWRSPDSQEVRTEPTSDDDELCVKIAFSARFDHETLEVETFRYFDDLAAPIDPFNTEGLVPIPQSLLRESGFFLVPVSRTWDRMMSFGSELFRRVVAMSGSIPAGAVLSERERLWRPQTLLEDDPGLEALVNDVNNELGLLFARNPRLALRVTSTDTDAVLDSIVPHYSDAYALHDPRGSRQR